MTESRPNWLSEIIEQHRRTSDRPVPLIERIAERDAIVAAIQAHSEGQLLAAMPDLADVVWSVSGPRTILNATPWKTLSS